VSNKISIHTLQEKKQRGERITMLTAYDYPSGQLVDASGVDVVLVGDSLGMVVHGFETTIPVTMDMMVMHCAATKRGIKRALLIGDMPFGSYQTDISTAKRNAARLLQEGGVDAVKLEGGEFMADTVCKIVEMGIAVHGHIGLTPQSVSAFGGFKVQGKTADVARQLIKDALAIQDAGAFAIVLEGIPSRLAKLISEKLTIPTIGIGAGSGCDGQVLVFHDLLGLFADFTPKFVKKYAHLREDIVGALEQYNAEVRDGHFPTHDHEYTLSDEVWQQLKDELGE
jgi:3-methyl-2-oxobutanoate hydroxymethyltransferase